MKQSLYVKGMWGLLNLIPNFFNNLSMAKSPPPNKRMQSAPPMYSIKSSSKQILNPAVTIAWYIATPIVPTIESDARRVNSPTINNQLPQISEYAAMYDASIGKGMPIGLTNASAKFSMSAVFSYP